MPVPGLSLLGLKRIRGFVSILRYINPTIIIIIITCGVTNTSVQLMKSESYCLTRMLAIINIFTCLCREFHHKCIQPSYHSENSQALSLCPCLFQLVAKIDQVSVLIMLYFLNDLLVNK